MIPASKPPVRMESREPKSIRFTPTEWAEVCEMARRRGEEPSRLVRKLAMYALRLAAAHDAAEASLGMTGIGR